MSAGARLHEAARRRPRVTYWIESRGHRRPMTRDTAVGRCRGCPETGIIAVSRKIVVQRSVSVPGVASVPIPPRSTRNVTFRHADGPDPWRVRSAVSTVMANRTRSTDQASAHAAGVRIVDGAGCPISSEGGGDRTAFPPELFWHPKLQAGRCSRVHPVTPLPLRHGIRPTARQVRPSRAGRCWRRPQRSRLPARLGRLR
jgi:hypothetical protein